VSITRSEPQGAEIEVDHRGRSGPVGYHPLRIPCVLVTPDGEFVMELNLMDCILGDFQICPGSSYRYYTEDPIPDEVLGLVETGLRLESRPCA
jgi:hypothetical protein